MKKILFCVFIILIIIVIYFKNIDKKIYYFNITNEINENYSKLVKENSCNLEKFVNYKDKNIKIETIKNDINSNIVVNNFRIQNILVKADKIILNVGNDELKSIIILNSIDKIYEEIDNLLNKLNDLLITIRKYSKEDIYIVGFYLEDDKYYEIVNYMNIKLKDISKRNNVNYIKKTSNNLIKESVNIYEKISKNYCIK